jgi:hypothetical protein
MAAIQFEFQKIFGKKIPATGEEGREVRVSSYRDFPLREGNGKQFLAWMRCTELDLVPAS